MDKRWRQGEELKRALYLDGHCVGIVDSAAIAAWIVETMNRQSPVPSVPTTNPTEGVNEAHHECG